MKNGSQKEFFLLQNSWENIELEFLRESNFSNI